MDLLSRMQNHVLSAKNHMMMKLTERKCSACKGTGVLEHHYMGNTKISPTKIEECSYCGGTGSRKYQIFNWMRDPNGEKYISKKTSGIYKKEEL